jgi:hypothetical protein
VQLTHPAFLFEIMSRAFTNFVFTLVCATIVFSVTACDKISSRASIDANPTANVSIAATQRQSSRLMNPIVVKPVETTQGPLSLSVKGELQPNDGLTDLKLVIRLRNNGTVPLALMNGGTTQAPARHVFFVEADGEGVVSLVQKAYALPDPTPTVPVIPAATVLAALASAETTWQATLETVTLNRPYLGFPGGGSAHAMPRPITKIRVCVAYKLFSEKSFAAIKGHKGFFSPIGTIDQEQTLICSPVIELAKISA